MSYIKEGEWVDMANSVGREIAWETKTWIGRYQATPNSGGEADKYDMEIPAEYKLHKIIKIVRGNTEDGWTPLMEFSAQAISTTINGNNTFGINAEKIQNGFSVKMTDEDDNVDGTVTIIFAKALEADDTVVIDFVSLNSLGDDYETWNPRLTPQLSLPEWLENAFKYGILTRAFEKLATRGVSIAIGLHNMSEQKYNGGPGQNYRGGYLRKAAAYMNGYKDQYSSFSTKPLNYL